MDIWDYLKEKQKFIYKHWLESFWDSFGESSAYLKREADQFTNPFAYHVEECFKGILKSIVEEFDWEVIDPFLDRLAQIRAVQEGVPSKAVKFLVDLKGIIRENFGEDILKIFGLEAFLRLEDRINSLLIRYIDFYQKYRERLFEIRLDEFKRNNFLLLKRAGLVVDQNIEDPFSIEKKH
ncbi:hypothetical protein THC_0589 [Caldimicrobium thiodismutans]|uniref:Uncharacterized protein n=1 Tax=Caldimicrobium thiodismutans TaxID=1653476 RepID=A0A0U5AG75_9BACT|nr:RsbRD N-terminal domain-containing protein [Caldimicrobium thiodismutans]BAU22983.1 hypothetical protein THC_0589 [Caldimicrobium thiodismutans]